MRRLRRRRRRRRGGGEDEEEDEENTYLFYPAIIVLRRRGSTEKIAPVSVPGLNHLDTALGCNTMLPKLLSEMKNIS